MGTLIDPVPVTGFAANFSPMPRIAPPPLGREMEGVATPKFCGPPLDFASDFCSVIINIARGLSHS
jgi:hypothetical protein